MAAPAASFQKVYDPEARALAFEVFMLLAVVSPVTTALKATTSPLQEGGEGQGSRSIRHVSGRLMLPTAVRHSSLNACMQCTESWPHMQQA
jgi:hypothetical protein